MKVLETSFLVDYLDEQPYTLEYLEANPQAQYVVPTIALYELYASALRSDAPTKRSRRSRPLSSGPTRQRSTSTALAKPPPSARTCSIKASRSLCRTR